MVVVADLLNLLIPVAFLVVPVVYLVLFFSGLHLFKKVFSKEKLELRQFLVAEIIIYGAFLGIIYLVHIWNNFTPLNNILDIINYFELGSFSLLITTIPLTIKSNNVNIEIKRAGVLSLSSAIIFFFIGTLLALSNILQTNNQLSITIQQVFLYFFNAGAFLGVYNLLHSSIFLLGHYRKKIGFD